MSETQLFDEAKLAEIVELMGEELPTLVDAFESSGKDQMARMHSAGKSQDADGLAQAAHQLKGSAGNLGAAALQASCEAVERAARGGDLTGAEDTVNRITELYGGTLAELRRVVSG